MATELAHLIAHQGNKERGNLVYGAYGHVASWDPRGLVKVVLQVQRDSQDVPTLTDWVPLGTILAGPGYGVQVGLHGGASLQNPSAGEQVLVVFSDPNSMEVTVACLTFNDVDKAPGTNAVDLQAGELLFYHETGTYEWFKQDGTVVILGQRGAEVEIDPDGQIQLSRPSGTEVLIDKSEQVTIKQQTGSEVMLDKLGNVILKAAPPSGATMTLHASGILNIVTANGATITLDGAGNLTMDSTGEVQIAAAAGQPINLQVSGGGRVNVNGGTFAVARVGDSDNHGDVITTGSSVLFTD